MLDRFEQGDSKIISSYFSNDGKLLPEIKQYFDDTLKTYITSKKYKDQIVKLNNIINFLLQKRNKLSTAAIAHITKILAELGYIVIQHNKSAAEIVKINESNTRAIAQLFSKGYALDQANPDQQMQENFNTAIVSAEKNSPGTAQAIINELSLSKKDQSIADAIYYAINAQDSNINILSPDRQPLRQSNAAEIADDIANNTLADNFSSRAQATDRYTLQALINNLASLKTVSANDAINTINGALGLYGNQALRPNISI